MTRDCRHSTGDDQRLRTQYRGSPGTGSRCCALPGSAHKQGAGRTFINGHQPLHCSRLTIYIQGPDR
ncbi:unnamed protein product, partial [Staurois parvus]